MTEILTWILGIVLKTAAVCVIWITVKHLIRNGGGTLKELLATITMGIRYGCLRLRLNLTNRLREHAEEEETIKEDPNKPGVKVEGTVV